MTTTHLNNCCELDLGLPAIALKSNSLREAIVGYVERLRCRRECNRRNRDLRAAFRNLVDLDDHLLNDIGVTRDEVLWASKLPINVNAAEALNHRASKRRSAEPL